MLNLLTKKKKIHIKASNSQPLLKVTCKHSSLYLDQSWKVLKYDQLLYFLKQLLLQDAQKTLVHFCQVLRHCFQPLEALVSAGCKLVGEASWYQLMHQHHQHSPFQHLEFSSLRKYQELKLQFLLMPTQIRKNGGKKKDQFDVNKEKW